MVFGKEKKLEKCEFEHANDDPCTKTAKGISKTMQEALKLMLYLPTKPEEKYETATIIIYSQYHINLERGEGRYLRPQIFFFQKVFEIAKWSAETKLTRELLPNQSK